MTGMVPRPHRPTLAAAHQHFGAYVREVRLSKHMTLRRCAEAIGLAPGHLSNIENHRVTPPEEATIVKLAAVLEIPIGALLARAGRLGPDDLTRFWQSPLIPSLVMSSTGWTQDEAAMFQETVLASLAQSTKRANTSFTYLGNDADSRMACRRISWQLPRGFENMKSSFGDA